jgi:hypothetical protein
MKIIIKAFLFKRSNKKHRYISKGQGIKDHRNNENKCILLTLQTSQKMGIDTFIEMRDI